MKLVIALIYYVLLTALECKSEQSDEIYEIENELVEECKKLIGATNDDVSSLNIQNPTPTDKAKCFGACIMTKKGFFDPSGNIDKAKWLATIESNKRLNQEEIAKHKQVVETCLGTVKEEGDKCEMAGAVFRCILKGIHKDKP